MIMLASHPLMAALMGALWAVLACLLPLVRRRWRHAALWLVVLAGVPLLGWLTYLCGPGLGVLFLALGLSVLVWPPAGLLRRLKPAPQGLR
ncbi:DUF2484 family protein [Paracoccus sp. (in: a-proteobacteria)]|uniref:DUF2484 family protein n=1 Tax=Paracoccus sp. TaxID=267 RepID=UPI00321FC03A